ncbi:hypothetical protein KFE25_005203 [Diacronema lutheri]|uniref:Uncharacterized protein n=1 Tax=Diacronema lutheri TaxID=2081491 RepID=A0A8J5X5D6_DIALT|nr:hypothetical protein KFE25_005203 [Diacronema lutheri]
MPPRVLLALLLLAAVCGAESAPAILQPVDTHSDCAIVLSLHNATTCELTRFEHAVRTRPPGCDVVALYNTKPARKALAGLIGHDATYAGFVTATRALRARASGVHVVPYGDAETKAALFGMGYSATALHMFSPYNSGLSKAAWFVWGARQSYRVFWFAELDVLVGSTWAAIVATWPLGGAGSHDERLVSLSLAVQ